MKKTFAFVLILVVCFASNGFAEQFTLTNGMAGNYVFSPGTGMAGIVAVVHVGVRNETAPTNGISHYLEHLLFNGTRTLNQEQLYAKFDELGVYANAQTGKDYTAFMIVGRASDLDTLLGLLREQLFFSTLPLDKFEKEKGIVEQEMLKDEQDEDYRFNTLFDLQAKSGTPYQYPTLGSRASIAAITRDQVMQYYQTWFHPNNVTLLVAADAPISAVVTAAKKQLEVVAPGDIPLAKVIARPILGRDRVIETAPAKPDVFRFKAAIALPPLDSAKQHAALQAATELFEPQEFITGTPLQSVTFDLFRDRDFSQWEISGEYSGELDAKALRDAIIQAFDKWQKTGLTSNALKRAQLRRKKEEQKSSEQLQYWGLFRAQKIAIASEEVWQRIDSEREKLTANDVKRVFSSTIANPMFLFLEQTSKLNAVSADTKIAFKDTTLANGVRIIARQSPGNSIVGGHFLFANRSQREPQAMHGIAELAHTLLESGAANLPTDKWQDTLAALGLEWKTADDPNIPYDNYYTTPEFSFVRFDTPIENLAPSISLIVSAIQAPRWEDGRFEQAKKAAVGRAGRETGSARTLAQIELEKKLYNGEVLPSPYGTPASLQGIDISTLKSFASAYWNGANLIVTLDGPDSPEQMIAAGIPALSLLSKGEAIPKTERKIAAASGDFTVKAGKSQSFLIVAGYKPVDEAMSDEAVAVAGTLLSNRVQQVLRETKGWAYNVGASASLTNDGVMIAMSIGTKKELVDSAAIELKKVYQSFLTSTLPDSEITRTQHAIAGRNRMREAGRQYRAFRLGVAALNGKTLLTVFPGADRYDNVTSQEIRKSVSNWPQEFLTIRAE